MNLQQYKHIYLIGIGGISVSAIARLCTHNNIQVSGFDLAETELTQALEKEGCTVYYKEGDALPEGVDVVVYSEAVPKTDSFRVAAQQKNIPEMSAFQFWGAFAKDKRVVAISGTNGKSSTTAMVGVILEKAGLDPTVVVGTQVLQWGSNIRVGRSDILVIEADEYHAHMLEFTPEVACVTNIAPDHLDFYKDVADIREHYQRWFNSMPSTGTIVLNGDDADSKGFDFGTKKIKSFSLSNDNDIHSTCIITRTTVDGDWGTNGFNLVDAQEDWGFVELQVPGKHNVANALAAAAIAEAMSVDRKQIIKALDGFKGTWRRFERVGEYNGALVLSDYAHHPAGIKTTLEACREWFPFRRLVVVFQPHQHNRTKNLFTEFVKSFDEADVLILSEIYDVAGRKEDVDADASSQQLVDEIKKRHTTRHPEQSDSDSEGSREQSLNRHPETDLSTRHSGGSGTPRPIESSSKKVMYAPDLTSAESLARETIQKDDVVIVMGAGDIDVVSRNLVSKDSDV